MSHRRHAKPSLSMQAAPFKLPVAALLFFSFLSSPPHLHHTSPFRDHFEMVFSFYYRIMTDLYQSLRDDLRNMSSTETEKKKRLVGYRRKEPTPSSKIPFPSRQFFPMQVGRMRGGVDLVLSWRLACSQMRPISSLPSRATQPSLRPGTRETVGRMRTLLMDIVKYLQISG